MIYFYKKKKNFKERTVLHKSKVVNFIQKQEGIICMLRKRLGTKMLLAVLHTKMFQQ